MDERSIAAYLTPYKYGRPVLTGSGDEGEFDAKAVDCPFVFRHNGKYYMMYVGFDGQGYQTGLAVSDDLLHWAKLGVILSRGENAGWDRVGAAGVSMLRASNDLNNIPELKKVDGKYWMIYHSYPEEGYEAGAARIGLAWCDDESLLLWHRLPAPVMSWENGADWEKGGLYKGFLMELEGRYYLYYNAKNITEGSWHEQIGIAFSDNMMDWKRYEGNPVLRVTDGAWDSTFCSDPFVVRDGDRWLMFYYGFDRHHAQDGIAVSYDLLHWEKYPEPILSSGATEEELDFCHAHKPSVLRVNGTLYHFYCAVRHFRQGDPAENLWNEFRCITVAASKPFEKTKR
jgi:predicted GH43/DUF377 family glycosyl hydrolase